MPKKKILLVDDEKDLVYAVTLELEANNFEVVAAYDGKEALDKARRLKPDLIILDLMLPKLDGYKVCRMLKFDEKYKNIPIIMFTARVQERDRQLGKDVGADAYITKPFESQALIAQINQLLKD